jgi:hypothetical protein
MPPTLQPALRATSPEQMAAQLPECAGLVTAKAQACSARVDFPMPHRITIIGNAGGGKSLWALRVGRALDIPVHVVDNVQWQPGWTRATPALVRATHAAWLAEPTWIIDGWGPWDDISARFALADLIVVPDYPLAQHRAWAIQRQAEVERGERRDWPPPGCDASTLTDELLALIDLVESDFMPRVRDMIEGFAHKAVRARSPEALDVAARSLEAGLWPVPNIGDQPASTHAL